jgi:hypothetical protein
MTRATPRPVEVWDTRAVEALARMSEPPEAPDRDHLGQSPGVDQGGVGLLERPRSVTSGSP